MRVEVPPDPGAEPRRNGRSGKILAESGDCHRRALPRSASGGPPRREGTPGRRALEPSRGPLRRLSCESSVRGEPPGPGDHPEAAPPRSASSPGTPTVLVLPVPTPLRKGHGEFGDLESGEVRGTPNRRRLRRAGGVRWAGSHARSFHGGSKMRISRSSTERGEAVRWTHRRIGRPPRAAVRIAWFTLQFVDCPPRKQFLGWMRA